MRKNQPKKFKKTQHGPSKHPTNQPQNFAEKAILSTLRYRQIFNCPMSYYQIWNYLIASKPVSERNFIDGLSNLTKEKKISYKDGWYSIDKIDYEKLRARVKRTDKLLTHIKHIAKYLKQLPWIEMLAVTGSVAAFNANEESDIDILIVTKPKRLFLSRLFLVGVLKLIRVYWNTNKPAGTICPNILLTTDNLTWDSSKQNLYTANEVSLLYPLFYRHTCYFDFLKSNSWVNNYLPNIQIADVVTADTAHPSTAGKVINILEALAMKAQTSYMKNKRTTEVVSVNLIHFNTHDYSASILRKFADV